jgi:hypothetical protein
VQSLVSFCIELRRPYFQATMLELEVYAAGLSDLDKILELDHRLAGIPGLRYKVDRNHNLVYFGLDQPAITFREIRAIFRKLGLDRRDSGRTPTQNQNAAAGCLAATANVCPNF